MWIKRLAGWVVALILGRYLLYPITALPQNTQTFKIGWISALTGPVAKYGAYQAALLAVEDINAAGGILGHPLELIVEDGKCDGATAASAAQKLIHIDGVKFILGGHCSTETLALAPIAERSKVLVLASISTSPSLTHAGRFIFRTSPVSTQQSDLLSSYLRNERNIQSLAILYEDTSYAGPLAARLQVVFASQGGQVTYLESFLPGSTDFRAMLTKIKSLQPQALFLGVQAQDTAALLVRQVHELGLQGLILGNEAAGNAAAVHPHEAALFDGLLFAEPRLDLNHPRTHNFIRNYAKTYKVDGLPYGIWTAESYDGVRLLAQVINACGTEPENVRECLLKVHNYQGVSGTFSINADGDAVRDYVLKTIRRGRIEELN